MEVSWHRSSHSGASGSSCVEVAWHKSSYSNDVGSACVEVAWSDGVLVRDSKHPAGPVLSVPVNAWHRLLTSR